MNELVRFALTAFFPREGDLPGLAELGVEDKIAALRRESTPLFWVGLVGASLFFQLSPILSVYRPLPAALLSEELLDAHAYALATSRFYFIRQIMVLLKLVAGMFWGQSPEIRAHLALPAYAADPGTRRTEERPARLTLAPRKPIAQLVELGRREEERGRVRDAHALEAGKNA